MISMIRINDEFKQLIPPLTAEEYAGLEKSILEEGCRDALVLWGNVLIDGHNRYEICMKHDIPFETVKKEFNDKDAAIRWIILNQFGRRNLPAHERARLALRLKPMIAKKAKEKQGQRNDILEKYPECSARVNTREEIAKLAGVSDNTIQKVEHIEEKAPNPIIEASRKGEISVNSAYQVTKLEPEKQQEIAERIQNIQNEPEETKTPKAIVQDVLKRPENQNNTLAKALQELSAFERKYSTIKELKPVFDAIKEVTT